MLTWTVCRETTSWPQTDDGPSETFGNDAEANAMLTRNYYRKGFEVPPSFERFVGGLRDK